MATTNFTDKETVIEASWLNDVDDHVYDQSRSAHAAKNIDDVQRVFATVAAMAAATDLAVGDRVVVEDYATGNNSGVLFGKIVAAGTGTDDGGSYIDLSGSGLQFEQNFPAVISVKMFGAVGDGSTDDTTAIQAALDLVSVVDGSKSSRWLHFPWSDGGYKVTATLELADCYGLRLTFESPNHGRDALSTDFTMAQIQWHGAANEPVFEFTEALFFLEIDGLTVYGAAGANRALSAVSFGRWDFSGGGDGDVAKRCRVTNSSLGWCRYGITIGNDDASKQPDTAHISFENVYFYENDDAGIVGKSGNMAGVSLRGCNFDKNGQSPTNDSYNSLNIGANIIIGAGQMDFYSCTSSSHAPNDANIYCIGNGLNIVGFWADTLGKFLVQSGDARNVTMNGVIHYNASMTDTNTPTSIDARCNMTMDGCYWFGDVELTSAVAGHLVASGCQFHDDDLGTKRPTLGIGKFKGSQITTQRGFLWLGNDDTFNEARLSIGLPPRSDGGDYKPATIHSGRNRTGLVRANPDDDLVVTESLNASQYQVMVNAYNDNATYKSVASGGVGRLLLSSNQMQFDTQASAASADETLTFGTPVFRFYTNGTTKSLKIGANVIGWNSAAPTSGTWAQGDVVYNTSAAVGSPSYWQCTVAGSPGTWVAGANL